VFACVEDMVAKSDVDAVAVCVPPQFHRGIAETALRAGKHIYLEKPIAHSLEDARSILENASRADVTCIIGFNLRRHRLVEAAVGMIREGRIGEPRILRSQFTSGTRFNTDAPEWRLERSTGGLLKEQAIHHFDLWRLFLRSEMQEMRAVVSGNGAEALVTGRMQNGILVEGMFSEATTDTNEIAVLGTEGQIRLSLYEYDGLEWLPRGRQLGSAARRMRLALRKVTTIPAAVASYREGGEYVASYRRQWEYFAERVRSRGPVDGSLEDGYRALEIVLAAETSAKRGQTVSPAEVEV
jgi:myo-inositol 2-dehydrogenase/D-chiro-inositol 1-dehydrogenase